MVHKPADCLPQNVVVFGRFLNQVIQQSAHRRKFGFISLPVYRRLKRGQYAPANAIRLDMKNYQFDGNSLVVTRNYKSDPTNKTRGDRDGLLYITSGKMRFFQDDIDVIAGPGDAIRETTGRFHNWNRMEDSSLIGISTAPAAPLETDAPSDY